MRDYATFWAGVGRVLSYAQVGDVADPIRTPGNTPVESWQSEGCLKRFRRPEKALAGMKIEGKQETVY